MLEAQDADKRVPAVDIGQEVLVRSFLLLLLNRIRLVDEVALPLVQLVFAEIAGRVVGREDETEGVAPAFARELGGVVWIDDGACVDDRVVRVENLFAFEEERALLLKENGKALISCDDGLIGFDLREVRVVGEIKRDRWRQSLLGRQADVGLDGAIDEEAVISDRRAHLRKRRGR